MWRPALELTERQEQILRAVVSLYTTTARPVGSAALLSGAALQVSSATVRNEMAALEEAGYVRQLHTSGGRVPTNLGYRYYVEKLMQADNLPPADANTIRHQFHQVHSDMHEWLRLAATVMANRMHNVGIVTAPKSTESRLRHLEVLSIQNALALLIVVVQDGTVLQEMVNLAEPHAQETLSALSARLNAEFHGLTASAIEARLAQFTHMDATVGAMIVHLLRRGEGQHVEVIHAGLADMIRQPEFAETRPGPGVSLTNQRLGRMVEFLHQGYAVQRLLAEMPANARVQVVIGGDLAAEGLADYSFVLGRYGSEHDSTGFLGVIGPTRMEYPRAVALVRYMSHLMTDLMQAY